METSVPTQQPIQPVQPEKVTAPAVLVILSWLLLLGGISQTLGSFIVLIVNPIIGLISLIVGIFSIVLSVAMRQFRRWVPVTMWVIAGLAVLGSIHSLMSAGRTWLDVAGAILQILTALYIWSIRDKYTR